MKTANSITALVFLTFVIVIHSVSAQAYSGSADRWKTSSDPLAPCLVKIIDNQSKLQGDLFTEESHPSTKNDQETWKIKAANLRDAISGIVNGQVISQDSADLLKSLCDNELEVTQTLYHLRAQ